MVERWLQNAATYKNHVPILKMAVGTTTKVRSSSIETTAEELEPVVLIIPLLKLSLWPGATMHLEVHAQNRI